MVIEHSFVTTMDRTLGMRAASEFLQGAGFKVESKPAFELGSDGWTDLDLTRGRKNPARAKDPTECPQSLRIEWDRGRVTVAASITPRAYRRSFSVGAGAGSATAAITDKTRPSADLMVAICRSIELLLAHGAPAEQAAADWYRYEAVLKDMGRKERRRSAMFLGIFLLIIFGFIALIVVAAMNSHR